MRKTTTAAPRPEYDLLEDGYVRGFAGDAHAMRSDFRTPAALYYTCDQHGLDGQLVLATYKEMGCPPITTTLVAFANQVLETARKTTALVGRKHITVDEHEKMMAFNPWEHIAISDPEGDPG